MNPEQYMNIANYQGRVQAIVWEAREYFSATVLADAVSLVEHGEAPEGMRILAWLIVSEGTKVPRRFIEDVREHASGLIDDEDMPKNLLDFAR